MIWLTWRQFRPQAIAGAVALVAAAIALAATGPHLASMFDSSGLATCRATAAPMRATSATRYREARPSRSSTAASSCSGRSRR